MCEQLTTAEIETLLDHPDHAGFAGWLTGDRKFQQYDLDRDGGIDLEELEVACSDYLKHKDLLQQNSPEVSSATPPQRGHFAHCVGAIRVHNDPPLCHTRKGDRGHGSKAREPQEERKEFRKFPPKGVGYYLWRPSVGRR